MLPLLDLPHDEARRLAPTVPVFVFVNPVEYHGPHLSLHNDRLVSHGLARDLHARLWPDLPLLAVADLEVGVEPCPGPGTRAVPFATVRRAVLTTCDALVELGARRVVLMTFHGAPLHALALEDGVRRLARAGVRAASPFNLVIRSQLDLDPSRWTEAVESVPEADRADVLASLRTDFHAGFFETSLTLHYAPDSVSDVRRSLPACPAWTPDAKFVAAAGLARALGATELAAELMLAANGLGWNAIRPFPGYTSRPALATAEAGAVFARRIVDQYVPAVRAALEGEAPSPAPILRWLRALTLGGRLAAPAPSARDVLLPQAEG